MLPEACVAMVKACDMLSGAPLLLRDIELLDQLEENLVLGLQVLVHLLQVNDTDTPSRLIAVLLFVEVVVQLRPGLQCLHMHANVMMKLIIGFLIKAHKSHSSHDWCT